MTSIFLRFHLSLISWSNIPYSPASHSATANPEAVLIVCIPSSCYDIYDTLHYISSILDYGLNITALLLDYWLNK